MRLDYCLVISCHAHIHSSPLLIVNTRNITLHYLTCVHVQQPVHEDLRVSGIVQGPPHLQRVRVVLLVASVLPTCDLTPAPLRAVVFEHVPICIM